MTSEEIIFFFRITGSVSWQIVAGVEITSGLSPNSAIMTYDALRMNLFVASTNLVKVFKLEFGTCFG